MFAYIIALVSVFFNVKTTATHYVRQDMNGMVFTVAEHDSLIKAGESIASKLVPAKKAGEGVYITIANNKANGIYKVNMPK